eukprot:CAMPEP_0119493326 /NCGR_PEP_ID=MMETSP1344-20130328/17607_1 /TAXON_ID=236787 /ORGANISM="Florenciella parvula, Strain CCMP2471" /LENGTH=208 /DNA_ID=CAMNT_0007528741 /DNA_START=58 /DNA_END=684 /DNA_ORIENTATION=-
MSLKRTMSDPSSVPQTVERKIHLNVGGTRYITTDSTLLQCPESMLAAMFSGRFPVPTDAEGAVFIDRDGSRFRHVLNWLRSGTVPSFDSVWRYEEVLEEASYYALQDLETLILEKIEALQEEQARQQKEQEEIKQKLSQQQQYQVMVVGKNGQPATPNTVASAMRAMQENGGMENGMATGMVSPNGRSIAMTGTAHSPLNFADDGMDF